MIPSVVVYLGEETTIDGIPTWVDISAYVRLERGVTATRGSTYGAGSQPGTASLTLDNTDGRFTVGNTSSPYYPYVHLQSLVKIERDGRPMFVGRIQSMPLSWPSGGDETCLVSVSLADKLARFGRMTLRSYAVEQIMTLNGGLGDDHWAYWPLTEASSATSGEQAKPSGAGWSPMVPIVSGDATITFGSGAGPAGDGGSAVTFTPGTGYAMLQSSANGIGPGLTLGMAFSTTASGMLARLTGAGVPWAGSSPYSAAPGGQASVSLSLESYLGVPGIAVRGYYWSTAAYNGYWHFPASVLDGKTHSVLMTVPTLGTPDVYLDGVLLTATTAVGYNPAWQFAGVTLSVGGGEASAYDPAGPFAGTMSHVVCDWFPATYSEIPSNITKYAAAYKGSPDLATLTAIGTALLWRHQNTGPLIDSGVTDNISAPKIGSMSLAAALAAINETESGTLYVDGQDRLIWRNRRAPLSPAITLDAADVTPSLTYVHDMQGLVTVGTANQLGTTSVVRSADVTTIGEISGSASSISTTPGAGLALAAHLVSVGNRSPYIGSLTIDLATATNATYTAVRTGGILTKVTLTGMPAQTPPGSTVLEVVGESETITPTSWDETWTTNPAGLGSPRDVWIIGDPVYGVLGSTHRLGY